MALLNSPERDERLTDVITILRELLHRDPIVIHISDKLGDFPLHAAAVGSCPEIVTILLKAGAKINKLNSLGQTALHSCYSCVTAKVLIEGPQSWLLESS